MPKAHGALPEAALPTFLHQASVRGKRLSDSEPGYSSLSSPKDAASLKPSTRSEFITHLGC